MDLDHNSFRTCAQCIIKAGIKRAIASNGAANSNNGNDKCGGPKNKDGDLSTGSRQQRLNPLAAELVAERHRYFPFGASARR